MFYFFKYDNNAENNVTNYNLFCSRQLDPFTRLSHILIFIGQHKKSINIRVIRCLAMG